MADRTPRETQTRQSQERKVWRPGTALEAPEPPLGFKHRWIRESVMEYDLSLIHISEPTRPY